MRNHPDTTLRVFRRHLQVPVSALLLALFPLWSVQVKGATLTWNQTATGTTYSWITPANWTPTGFPNAIGDIANLNNAIAGAQTINLNQVITLGALNIGDTTTTNAFTLAAGTGGYLMLDVASGNAAITKALGADANDIISTGIQFNDTLAITNASTTGSLTLSGGMRSLTSDITFNGAGAINVSTAGIATGGNLIKSDAGITTLSIGNTYAGTTSINGGSLRISSTTGLPIRSAVSVGTGAALDLNAAFTMGSLAGAGDVTNVLNTARILTVGRDDTSTIFSGRILPTTAANIAITKIGAGTLLLNPTSASTYTGNTIINGGTINLSFANTSATSLLAATPLQITGGNFTMTGKAALAASQLMGALTVGVTGGGITLVAGDASGATLRTGAVTATASGGALLITAPTNTTFQMGTSYAATSLNNRLVFSDGTANTYNWAINTGVNTTTTGFLPVTALPITGGGLNTTAYILTASQTQTTAASTIRSLKLSSTSGSTQTLDLATFNMTLGGGTTATPGAILIDGTAAWDINGTTGVLRSAHPSAAGDVIFHQYSTGGVTVNAGIADNGTVAAAVTNLVKAGTGQLTLAGTNTFTGAVFVNGGILSFSNVTAAGAGSLGNGSATAVTIRDGATLQYTGLNGSIAATGAGGHTFTLQGGNANIDITQSGTALTLSGVISGAGGFTKLGVGTLITGVAETYTGPTIVDTGTLKGGIVTTAFGALSPVTIKNSAILDLGVLDQTIGSLSSSSATAAVNNITTAKTLTLGGDNTSTTYAGTFTGGIGNALAKVGSGILTLSGTTSSWTGSVSVNGGVLRLGASGVLNTGSAVTIANAAGPAMLELGAGFTQTLSASTTTLTFGGSNATATSQGNVLIGSGAILTLGSNVVYSSTNNPLGALISAAGTGSLSLSGTRTFTIGDSTSTTQELIISAPISSSGSFSISKAGFGNLVLSGANTFSGATTTLTTGGLILDYTTQNNNKIPGGNSLTLNGGGNLVLLGNASADTTQSVLSTNLASGGFNTITPTPGGSQKIVLNLGTFARAASAGTMRFNLPTGTQDATNGITTTSTNTNGVLLGTGGAWATVTDSSGVTNFAINNGSNNIGLLTSTTKNDVTTWAAGDHITDDNTGFSGTTTVSTNINTLRFDGSGTSTVSLGTSLPLGVLTGGILQTANATNASILGGKLTSGTGNELIFTTDGATLTVSSTITGNETITKTGSGTLRLTGTNNYSGQTQLQGGTLQVSGGNAIGDSSTVLFSANRSAVLELLNSETIGTLATGGTNAAGGASELRLGTNTLTINQAVNGTYSGAITAGAGGRLIKTGAGDLAYAAASTSATNGGTFAGTFQVDQGLVVFNGNVLQLPTAGTAIALNGPTSSLRLDNDQTTAVGNRINSAAAVTLSNTAGTTANSLGLFMRRNGGTTTGTQTLGQLVLNAGHNTVAADGTAASRIGVFNFTGGTPLSRSNLSTLFVVGRSLGDGSATQGSLIRFATDPGGSIGGGGAALSSTISIFPYIVGEATAGAPDGSVNFGNSFVRYVSAAVGLQPLNTTTEYVVDQAAYDALGAGVLTNNVRFTTTTTTLASDTTGINSLVLDSASGITVTGPTQSQAITGGAILSTGVGANVINGFTGITTGANPYYVYVTSPTGSLTLTSPLTTAQALVKSGAGTLTLGSASNSFTDLYFNQGVVQAGAQNVLGTGALNFFGGTLKFTAAFDATAGPKTILLGTGGGTFDTNGFSPTFANTVGSSGTGGLTKIGAGTLTLNGAATYTGATTVSAGSLAMGINSAIGTGALTVSGAAAASLDMSTFSATVSGLTLGAGAVNNITGSGTLTVNGDATVNQGSISALLAGSMNLTKATTSQTATLSNTGSTFTGYTHVQNGILAIASVANAGSPSSLGAPTGDNAVIRLGNAATTGTLQISAGATPGSTDRMIVLPGTTGNGIIDNDGVAALTLNGNILTTEYGAKTLTLQGDTTGFTNTVGGVIADGLATLALTKAEAGTWALTGANTFTGGTTVNAGTLTLDATAVATPANGVIAAGSALTLGGGTLNVLPHASLATTQTFASTTLTGSTYSILSATGSGGGLMVNTGVITRNAASGVNVNLISSPTVTLTSATAPNGVVVDANGIAFMTVNGTDWANLSTQNVVAATYTADTYTAGTNTDVTTFASNPSSFTTNTLRFNAGGGGTLTLAGTNIVSAGGLLVGSGSGAVIIGAGGTLAGAAGAANRELNIFQNSASTATINAVIANNDTVITNTASATALNKYGTGLLVLGGSNTFTGGVNVASGTVRLGNAGALNSTVFNSVTLGGAGTLQLFNNSVTMSGLNATAANAGAIVENGGVTTNAVLTVRNAGANTFAGVLRDGSSSTLGLTQVGTAATGVLTLTGVNTYTGPTTVGGAGVIAGSGISLSGTGQITATSGITFSGGTLTITNTTAQEGGIDRVNAAAITSNGGAITITNTAGNSYAETLGAVALSSGRMVITSTNATTAPATQLLTLGGLSQSGTATLALGMGGFVTGTPSVLNQINITGQATTTNTIIGPWATVGTGASQAQTDYATYNFTGGTMNATTGATTGGVSNTLGVNGANITSVTAFPTTTTAWSNTANMNLNNGTTTTTLVADTNLNTLRYTGGAASVATSTFKLGTFGVLQAGTGLLTISGTGALTLPTTAAGNVYLTTGTANGITVSAPINDNTGALTLVVGGQNAVTLSSTTSNYSGGTVVNSGTLSIAADTNLGATTGGLTFNGGGTLAISATGITLGASRTVTINNGAMATVSLITGASNTIAGQVTGTGGLIATGITTASTLTLSATNNNFTGPIRVTNGTANIGGTLIVNSLADSLSPGTGAITLGNGTLATTFTYGAGAIAPLVLNNRQIELAGTTGGGILDSSSAGAANTLTINTDLLITGLGAKTLTLQGTNSGIFAGKIGDGTGSVIGLTKSGVGIWNVTGTANTFTGAITIAAGTLNIASFGGANLITFSGTTGTGMLRYTGAGQSNSGLLSLSAVTTGTQTLDASGSGALNLSNTGAIAVGAGVKSITLRGTNTGNNTLAGILQDNSATNKTSILKLDRGQWVLTNNNTYTGTTSVNNGTMTLDFTNTPVKTNIIAATSALTLGGGTLNLVGHSTATTQTFASTALTANTMSTVSATAGAGGLTVNLGAITRNANTGLNVTLSGSPAVNYSVAAAGWASANGLNVSATTGAAFMTLNGTDWANGVATPVAATYTNDTFTTSTNNINVTTSGAWAGTSLNTLRFDTGTPTLTITGTNTLGAGGILIGSGAGAVNFGGASSTGTVSGTAFTTAGGELNIFNYSSSAATINAGIINNVASNSYLAAAPVGDALNVFGTGTTILNASRTATTFANAYTGGTNISGSATLQLGKNNAIPFGTATPGALSISGGATLDLNGKNQIVNGLQGLGLVNNTTASAINFTIGSTNATSTFAGSIQNTGGGAVTLVKTGSGTITLNGQNTYTGSTTISQGTLLLDFTTSPINVRSNILPQTALTLGSGTLNVTGQVNTTSVNSQSFNGTTLNGGGAVTLAGTTPAVTVNLGAITRTAGSGGTLNVTLVSPGVVNTSSTNNAAAILGGYVTVGGTDWGTVNASGNIVAYSAYTGTLPTAATTDVNGNYTLAVAQTQLGASTINSLKATGTTYVLNTGNFNMTFSGANGGLISSATSLTIGSAAAATSTIGAGASNEFIIYNTGTVVLNSAVVSGSLTKSGTGTLQLRNTGATAALSGPVVINGGTLDFDAAARLTGATNVTLNGGTVYMNGGFSLAQNLVLGAAGGTIQQDNDADRTLGGVTPLAFVGSGPRTLTIANNRSSRVYTLPMAIGDADALSPTSINVNSSSDSGILRLNPAAASNYTGNTIITRGILRLATSNAINGASGLLSTATTGNIIFAATGTTRAILETSATVGSITRSVGYGPGQIHWEGNGGFSNNSTATQVVNLGGAGATLTWGVGGFVPTNNFLQFGQAAGNNLQNVGAIDFQNSIALGSAVRTFDVATAFGTGGNGGLTAILSGNLTSGANGGMVKSGSGTLLLTGANSGGAATINVSQGNLIFEDAAAIPGAGANITLSTTPGNNAAIGMLGDTNPIATFGSRLTNANTATAAFLLGADSSESLDFTLYPTMRLGAYTVSTPTGTPSVGAHVVTFTGTITPAGGTYRFGGQGATTTTSQAIGTLVLGKKDQLTGTNSIHISTGGLTITATNNVSGATTLTNNGIEASILGIGSNAALGTSLITFTGANTFRWGAINGDRSVSNNIAWDGASTANWVPNGDTANDGILRNTSQGTMSYLGEINLAGRNNPTLTVRPGAVLFLGDFKGGSGGFTYSQTTGGYLSLLSTSANGGVPKTYTGNTFLNSNAVLVIDSKDALGSSGNLALLTASGSASATLQLHPGSGSVDLETRSLTVTSSSTVSMTMNFNTPSATTLTIGGPLSNTNAGGYVKSGLGTLILTAQSPAAVSTGTLAINAGTLRLDGQTAGGTVWGATGQPLTLGAASGTFSNGGTLEITGTSAQTFGAVTVNPRANNINLTGAMTLTLGTITRTAGSTLNFTVSVGGTVASAHPAVAGLVSGSTTWNGNDWAAANGTNIGQLGVIGSYTALTGTASAPTITTSSTANYNITSGTTNNIVLAAAGSLSAPNDTNTIRYDDATARTIDVRTGAAAAGFLNLGAGGGATGTAVANVGGVLVASGAGALTIGVATGATGGTIMAGGTTTATPGQLVFINNSTSDITVNSAISFNGTTAGPTDIVYDGRNTGKLILAGNNTTNGIIFINKGTLEVSTVNNGTVAGPLGQSTAGVGNILLNGGTFRANLGANGNTDHGFTINAPSTIEVVANTLTLNTTLNGVASANAQLGILNAGILKKTGAGTLELKNLTTAANNTNLSVEVVAGTLLLNQSSTATISAIDLAGGAGLIIDGHASSSPTVRISGTGGNQISDASSVVVNSGTNNGVFDLNGFSETIDGLAGAGTVINNVTGTSTLTVGGNNSAGLSAYTLAAAAAGVNATGLNSFGGVIQDGGSGKVMALTKTGSGTQILTGNNTYTGATTISAGTLQLGIANALPSGVGKANVTIVGNNTGTNIGSVTTNGSDKVLAPGTLDMGGFDQAINGLDSTTGGFVTNNPTLAYNGAAWAVALARQGAKTLTLGNSIGLDGNFNGVIQDGFSVAPGTTVIGYVGTINLVKLGTNTQTLKGANTYGGSTAIQNGTLVAAGGTNRLPSTTAVTLGNLTTSGLLQLGDSAGAVSQTIAGLVTSGSGTANAVVGGNSLNATASTLIVNQTGSSTFSGALGGAGANQNKLNFTLQGGGTLTLNGANNTFTGATTVQGGSTLILDSNLASSAITVGGASAGTLISNQTLGALLTVGNGGVVAPGDLLASDIGTLTLNGGLTLDTGSTLALQIGSTATLTTPLVNDLITIAGGVFTLNGGQISLTELTPGLSVGAVIGLGDYVLIDYAGASNAAAFAVGTQFSNLSLASSVIGTNNYFVTLVHDTVNKVIKLNVDNARFWSGATDGQWNTTVANWSPVNPALYLNTDKVIFGDTYPIIGGNDDVVNSTIDLTTAVTPAAVTFNNTTVNYTLGGTGSIGGSTGLTKSGTASLVISSANNFTGNTVISGGYVEMQHATALGTTAGSISVGNGAALRLSGGIAVAAKATLLTGSGIANTGALRNVSGNNSFAGAITLTGDSRINSDSGLLTLSGGISNGANNLTFGGAGDITESGIIGNGAGTLTVDGTGIVTLSNAANTYTGQTFIKSGTLSVSNIGSVGVAGGLGNAPDAATGTIMIGDGANTGTLRWTGSASESTDRLIDLVGTTGGAVIDASGSGSNVLTLASALTFTSSGSKTLTLTGTGGSTGTPNVLFGAIADPGTGSTSLLKTGTGVWRLDAASTYTGGTTINGGTLLLGIANGLPTTAPTIGNGSSSATLNLGGLDQTLNGINFGGGSATSSAQGLLALGASGTLTLNGDVLYSAAGNPLGASITGSGTATLDLNAAVRTFNIASSASSGGADLTITAVIADLATGGSVVKTGAGTLVFTAANTYAGATTVNGGALSVTPAALGSTATINVGTNGTSAELNLYADNSATPVTLASDANLNIGDAASNGYLGFNLSGLSDSDAITLAGTGVLTIGDAGGIINARALSALTGTSYLLLDRTNVGGSIPINTNNGFYLGVLPGGYSYSLDNTTTTGQLYLTVGSAAAGPYYWTGLRSTDSWAQLGSGGTTSNWSTNQAGTADAGATPGNITVIFSADNAGASAINTTLDQAYSIAGLQFISNPAATGNVSISPGAGAGTLTLGSGGIDIQTGASSTSTTISAPVILGSGQSWGVTDSNQTLTVSGVVSGNGNLLTKTGAGVLVLSGANTFNGGTTINGGTVQINSASSLGAATGTVTINAATLQATADILESRNVSLGNAASTVLVDATKTLTFTNTASTKVSGSGVLNATGAGTLVLDDRLNANTYSGGSVLSGGGTVRIYTNTGLGSGAATVNAATLQVSGTISDTRDFNLGHAASAIAVDSGKVFTVANSASTKITGTGTLNANGAGTLVLDDSLNANDFSGGLVLSGGGTVKISSSTGLGSGAITINAATLNATATLSDTARSYTLGNAASIVTVNSGAIYTITNGASSKVTGVGRLNANGPGILVLDDLANANDYTGGSVLSGTGTVRISTATSLGAQSGSATINNATLQATENITTTRNFLLGSFGSKFSVDASKTLAISGTISDGQQAGTLNKMGAGTLTLSGTNGYTGGTFVTAGTLLINNSSGSGTGTGAISVTGATSILGGTGTASGTATIGSGATLNPGGALTAGTLTLGGLTLSSGSLLSYQLGAPASSDKTVVTGSGLFTANGGAFTLDTSTLAGFTGGTYNLITYTGALGGSFSNLSLSSSSATDSLGRKYFVSLVNNAGSVDLSSTNTLTWNGNQAGTVWQNGASPTGNENWKSGATTNINFFDTMVANFDDTATSYTVNLPGTVTPSSITVSAANDYTITGTGTITGTTGITKSGGGQLTIATNNDFSGNVALTAGAIEMQHVNALGTGNIAITPGASLRLNPSSGSITLGTRITSYSGGSAIYNVSGDNTATLPAGNLTAQTSFVSEAGTLTLAGNITPTTDRHLSLIGLGGNIVLSGATISSGNFHFTVSMTGGTATITPAITVGTDRTVTVNGTGATTFNGAISSASTGTGLSVSNSGTNNFNANVTVSGGGGGISLGGSSTNTFGASFITTWSSTGTASISSNGNTTFNGTLSGSGALTKSGTGTLTFNATSGAYSGAVNLAPASGQDRGIILATASNALGTGAVTATFATGATRAQIQLSGGISLGNSGFTTTGDGSDGTVSGLIRSTSGANIITGPLTMASGGGNTTLRADSTASLALNGAVTANVSGRYLNLVGAGNFSFGAAGSINDAGANTVGLWSSNSGTTTISSTSNSYSLATMITGGNTLNVAALAAVNTNSSIGKGSVAGSSNDLVIDGGTLQYNANTAAQTTNRLFSIGTNGATIDSSSGTAANTLSFTGAGALGFRNNDSAVTVGGTSVVTAGARTLTLTGTNTGANTLASLIGDQAAVTGLTSVAKTGAGTWVLTGNNSYDGTTTVSAGTLLINGNQSTANGAVGVTGATLGGNGTIGGAVSVNAGGILAAGSAAATAGTLTLTSSLSMAGTGIDPAETRLSFDFTNATGNAATLESVSLVEGWWTSYSGALLSGNGSQNNDLINLTAGSASTLTWGAGGKVSLNQLGMAYTWVLGDVLNLLDWTNSYTVSGSFDASADFDLPNLSPGLTWDTTRFLSTGALAVTPEPSRALLLMLGLLGLFFRRRRSR